MKRQRIIAAVSIILCFMMLLPSCNMHKKQATKETEEEEEDIDDEDDDDDSDPSDTSGPEFSMKVTKLHQFISDGSIFAENVPVPTPTPIPMKQESLGLTNDVDGYYSGDLNGATIVDNEYFKFVITSAEVTDEGYIVTSEYTNKTDVPYKLYMHDVVLNNVCFDADSYYYTEKAIEPNKPYVDVTNFASEYAEEPYDFTVPTRISFLMIASPTVDGTTAVLADPENQLNYIPVNLFPQGEDAYVYEEKPLGSSSEIILDSEGAQMIVDGFDLDDTDFTISYTYINKTSDYIQLRLDDHTITIDKMVYEVGSQAAFIPPYSRRTGFFRVSRSLIEDSGLDPNSLRLASIPLRADSLNNGVMVLWQTTIKTEIHYG
ncbi:MAG: hypothetical protein J5653_04905 [Clostridiales bacterium]|nr:hypothetical protein [Clostridiales bacterium]